MRARGRDRGREEVRKKNLVLGRVEEEQEKRGRGRGEKELCRENRMETRHVLRGGSLTANTCVSQEDGTQEESKTLADQLRQGF